MKDLILLEIRDFEPTYDEAALNRIIEEVSPIWEGVSLDEWLKEIRGEEDE